MAEFADTFPSRCADLFFTIKNEITFDAAATESDLSTTAKPG